MKKTSAKGHTIKHAHATKKHASTAKHKPVHHAKAATAHGSKVTAKAKPATHAKARALGLDGIGCCGAEALAASLRLAGVSVTGADVLELHQRAGADDKVGAPIEVLLEAAAEFGLAGRHLLSFETAAYFPGGSDNLAPDVATGAADDPCVLPLALRPGVVPGRDDADVVGEDAGQFLRHIGHLQLVTDVVEVLAVERHRADPAGRQTYGHDLGEETELERRRHEPFDRGLVVVEKPGDVHVPVAHALILGVDLPGPHAVVAASDGWWSWGDLWCPCEFPDAVIEEAWAVTWA